MLYVIVIDINSGLSAFSLGLLPSLRFVDVWGDTLGYATIWYPCPETGGVRTTDGEGEKLEMPSDDEEVTIPSKDRADVRNVDIHDEQSENTQREWDPPSVARKRIFRKRTFSHLQGRASGP